MEKVKVREIFNKVKKFNELAGYLYQGQSKVEITFDDGSPITRNFESYKDFSRFVRGYYIDVLSIRLLNGEWTHDGEFFTIEFVYEGDRTEFELYVHTAE